MSAVVLSWFSQFLQGTLPKAFLHWLKGSHDFCHYLCVCSLIEMILWPLPLGLRVCSDEAHWFARFELSMYPQNKISLAMVHLFVVFLNLVYRNFRGVRVCVLCVSACLSIVTAELIYNFLCFILFWIWCWDNTGPAEWVWWCSLPDYFIEQTEEH